MSQHEFSVLDSKILVESPILAMRQDTVTMPGETSAKREIIEHFGAVAVVALDADGRVALVEQYRHSVKRRLLELPAGLLDFYQEDPVDAARRELVEEAGLKAGRWDLLLDVVTSPGFAEEAVRIFVARDLQETERPEAEFEEADMSTIWMPLDEAVATILRGGITNSIAVSGLLAAHELVRTGGNARSVDTPFDLRPTALPERRHAQGVGKDLKKLPRA